MPNSDLIVPTVAESSSSPLTVDAIGTLINQDCDWSIGASIGHALDHFFHDQRIADHKPYDLRCLGTGFATQNVTQVEFSEEHQVRPAEAGMYNALQIREGCRR